MQFYEEKLSSSREFEDFIKENKDAYLCSGFFVIDKDGKDNKQHLDYYLPKEKKMISFQMEEGIKKVFVDMLDDKVPKKISKPEFDFEDMEEMIQRKMQEQDIKNKIQKIIFSLQNLDGKDFLICTVFISMLGILRVNIDISDKKITEFEKKSFFDIMKVTKKKNG